MQFVAGKMYSSGHVNPIIKKLYDTDDTLQP